jgi:hypothetical protein
MSKRNFRVVVFSLLAAGLVLMAMGVIVGEGRTQTILLSLTGAFYLAAAIQIAIYRTRPKLFDEKQSWKERDGGEGK